VEDKGRTFPKAIIAEPFPGAAPPFGSKDDDPDSGTLDPKDENSDSDECEVCGHDPCECESAEASFYTWGTFALEALPDTLTSDPGEHEDAVDHSKDGEARDTSVDAELRLAAFNVCLVGNCLGFMTNALRSVAGQPGITSPVSKLPTPPPGAAEKAKEKAKKGRGVEGDEDEGVDPMSTLDKFNWDNLPLPGLGQI
jgi:hypothetical protein